MTTKETTKYYKKTKESEVRAELRCALAISSGRGIAIDCGCGAGANIAHLRAEGYIVHAFDIDKEAYSLCVDRFAEDPGVSLSIDSFGSFHYPAASLIVADASLFFCPEGEFDLFLKKVRESLNPQGVFCGSFLGTRDTMASPGFEKDKYWGDVLVVTESHIRQAFGDYKIHHCIEHEIDGISYTGEYHHWHIFSLVAKRV